MPIYEYECKKCANQIEVFQKINDEPPSRCPKCGGRLEKMLSAPAIQFKGTGWYVTDYAGGSRQAGKKAEESDGAKEDKKKEVTTTKETSDKSSSKKLPSD
jgi:putative FmdB family regulatory protein